MLRYVAVRCAYRRAAAHVVTRYPSVAVLQCVAVLHCNTAAAVLQFCSALQRAAAHVMTRYPSHTPYTNIVLPHSSSHNTSLFCDISCHTNSFSRHVSYLNRILPCHILYSNNPLSYPKNLLSRHNFYPNSILPCHHCHTT